MRRDYQLAGLKKSDIDPDPFTQFKKWFGDAVSVNIPEPNAMVLATVGEKGHPATRTVLLKEFSSSGFVFYTNYSSRKGQQIEQNPNVSLLFPWLPLERQIEIRGTATKVSREETEAYFYSRPIGSQLGAWASYQSQVLPDRTTLEKRIAELMEKYRGKTIPLPPFWGGYRVNPSSIEFWQGQSSRLHDRLRYTRDPKGQWKIERLSP
ncbi:MAG: pyridoxamine 5'-phosphate oxidase [Opitutaceae bacterium]|nr:pyridoxamine 5'-phosphate oxidase [Opitutaceae bacterium]